MATRKTKVPAVFLNVPYDAEYEELFVALVGGLVALGRRPTCAVEVPADGKSRMRRIFDLIKNSDLSIHDLSRVEVGRRGLPRFNMPFELGLCCALIESGHKHRFHVFEGKSYRLQESLSDLNEHDPRIHGSTQVGVLRELLNCLGSSTSSPSLPQLKSLVGSLWSDIPKLKRTNSSRTIYQAHIYRQLVAGATQLAADMNLIKSQEALGAK